MKLLFVSASPVLVNEVKRFYIDMKAHLNEQLTKRRNAKLAGAGAAGDNAQEEEKKADVAIEEAKEEQEELLQKFVEIELSKLERDENIEKQTEIVARFSQLT